jgi:predicted enzyme related to lactoylglutathione lyase
MSERDSYEAGTPCWVDHSSSDPDRAVEFYGGLFGWETEDVMPSDAPGRYFMCRLRGRDVAAVSSAMGDAPRAMWNTYVAVDSADDAVARAREAGGNPMGDAFDVFDSGRMAVLADPEGAVFSVWQAGRHHGAGIVNEPGALSWNELMTRDADRALTFYGAVFGWEPDTMDYGGVPYHVLKRAGAEDPIGGMMPMVGDQWPADLPAQWMVYFAVDDADQTVARCGELGGAVAVEPFDTSVGRIAVLSDPLGGALSVIRLPDA